MPQGKRRWWRKSLKWLKFRNRGGESASFLGRNGKRRAADEGTDIAQGTQAARDFGLFLGLLEPTHPGEKPRVDGVQAAEVRVEGDRSAIRFASFPKAFRGVERARQPDL